MKHKKKIIVIAILAIVIVLYGFAFKLKATKKYENERLIPFTTEGFIEAKELSNKNKLVAEQGPLKLYIDETTSYFWVEDSITGEVIRSNPNIRDPRQKLAVNEDAEWLNAALILSGYNMALLKFDLPTVGQNGSLITYQSSNEAVITNDLAVIKPLASIDVNLTATFSDGINVSKRVYVVTVNDTGIIMVTSQNDDITYADHQPKGFITNEAIEKQKSTLEISYYNKSGSINSSNNYGMSIYHPESVHNEEGQQTFAIKYLTQAKDNKTGFQVYYTIEDLEIDKLYFPKYMTQERFDSLPDHRSTRFVKNQALGFNEAKKLYFLKDYENLSLLAKRHLYTLYYELLKDQGIEFSREQAIEENALYGYLETSEILSFKIGVEVILTEEGFKTSVIKDSLVEPKHLKIADIALYPFLGTAVSLDSHHNPTSGYMVVPDGSGAVINFNNDKIDQRAYKKRIYSSDLSNQSIKLPEEQELMSLPIYGMIKENIGLASIVEEGAPMTFINADISERRDSYNKIYPSIQYRENYLHTLGTGWNTYSVSLWSKGMADTDLVVNHVILRGADNNYNGIAKAYQNYLIKEKGLVKQDIPTKAKTTIEFLGAYDVKEYMLGIPYNKIKSLTTFNQAKIIANEFIEDNYDINVLYNGALNGGLRNSIQTKVKFEGVLGGKKGYKRLNNYLEEHNINMFLQVNVSQARTFRRAFDEYTYAAQRLEGSLTRDYQYHLPSGLPYSETRFSHSADDYILSSRYYQSIYNKVNKKVPTDYISFTRLGSNLIGSYRGSDTIYAQDSMYFSEEILKQSNKNVMLRNPLGFALPYSNYAIDLPMETTLFAIVDYAIPLNQLVLSGFIPYTSKSLNLLTQRTDQFNFLKLLETGSQPKYTLTYADPQELINTEYTKYLSTYYGYWVGDNNVIKENVDRLQSLNLYGGHLIEHEWIKKDLVRVKYSHGLEIYINYSNVSVNTIANGSNITIPSLDYKVV